MNSHASTQIPTAKKLSIDLAFAETPQTETTPAYILPIKYTAKSFSATLTSLALVKQDHKQLRKYLEQAKIAGISDICLLMDKSDVFIKNINVPPAQ